MSGVRDDCLAASHLHIKGRAESTEYGVQNFGPKKFGTPYWHGARPLHSPYMYLPTLGTYRYSVDRYVLYQCTPYVSVKMINFLFVMWYKL